MNNFSRMCPSYSDYSEHFLNWRQLDSATFLRLIDFAIKCIRIAS